MIHSPQGQHDTIVAIASPSGLAKRGIVRLSGPDTVSIVEQCFRSDSSVSSRPHCRVGSLTGAECNVPGRFLVWPTERSYTRQPAAEFHTFGSKPVLDLCVKALVDAGARLAEPGEFTMRAFLSGRIDLVQAEAVLAVIDAQDRRQLDVAIDQLAGGLGARLSAIRNELVASLAELEAGLDFVEEDIEFISSDLLLQKLTSSADNIDSIIDQIKSRDSNSAEYRVALFGLPNAGKSSLFNAIVDDEAAIVSPIVGTTTDRVTRTLERDGVKILWVDTAGQETDSELGSISSNSQQHRETEMENCDLAIDCIAATGAMGDSVLSDTDLQRTVVLTKSDLLSDSQRDSLLRQLNQGTQFLTSTVAGAGIEELLQHVVNKAIESSSSESGVVGSTVLRSRSSLIEGRNSGGIG